jgi:hypothetical protein
MMNAEMENSRNPRLKFTAPSPVRLPACPPVKPANFIATTTQSWQTETSK